MLCLLQCFSRRGGSVVMDVAHQISRYIQLAERVDGYACVFDVFHVAMCWGHSDDIQQFFWLVSTVHSQQDISGDYNLLSTNRSHRLYK